MRSWVVMPEAIIACDDRAQVDFAHLDELREDAEILLADGPACLVAKRRESGSGQNVFAALCDTADEVVERLERAEARGDANLYVVRNAPTQLFRKRRGRYVEVDPKCGFAYPPREETIDWYRWLALDIDPADGENTSDAYLWLVRREVLEALHQLNLELPLWDIRDSGRGVQALVRLAVPATAGARERELFRRCGLAIERRLSTIVGKGLAKVDAVGHVGRQTRLLGSVNSRTGRRCRILEQLHEEAPSLDELAASLGVDREAVVAVDIDLGDCRGLHDYVVRRLETLGHQPDPFEVALLRAFQLAVEYADAGRLSAEGRAIVTGLPTRRGERSEAELIALARLIERGESPAGILGWLINEAGHHSETGARGALRAVTLAVVSASRCGARAYIAADPVTDGIRLRGGDDELSPIVWMDGRMHPQATEDQP